MAYCDYAFYTDTYFGNAISEENFQRLSARASDYIYSYTKGAADNATGKPLEMVKKATCALAEVLQDEESMTANNYSRGGKLASESVGSWSKSYATAAINSTDIEFLDKRKADMLALYLGNLPEFSALFRVTSYRCVHDARRRSR